MSALQQVLEHKHRNEPASALMTAEVAGQCTRCGICQKDCSFLQEYGFPGDIAAQTEADPAVGQEASFACSLCGLCSAVCPAGLEPARLFLAFRREAFAAGTGDLSAHSRILSYERRGCSRRFSWYALPEACDTVLFPGCALPGTRPDTTIALYALLKRHDGRMGIVLDCCTKPSHDLGRQGYFQAMFSELCQYLLSAGVKTILVACPNCHKIFSHYGEGLQVTTVYEYIVANRLHPEKTGGTIVTVHDPCAIRNESGLHDAVRALVNACGLNVREMEHARQQTFCCGEGGAVSCIAENLSGQWGQRRRQETQGNRILTYCAGCAGNLGRLTPTDHLLDLLFAPERTLAGKARVSRAPFTYLNRLRLKKQLQRNAGSARTRERSFFCSRIWPEKKPCLRSLLLAPLSAL